MLAKFASNVAIFYKWFNREEKYLLNEIVYKPWGRYIILYRGLNYKMKLIEINPGAKLSLQFHAYRSEHWIITGGIALSILGNKSMIFRKGESLDIPVGIKHRLENIGNSLLCVIEEQRGKYIEEDDITRLDDIYGRIKDK